MTAPHDLGAAFLHFAVLVTEPLASAGSVPAAADQLVAAAGWDLTAVAGLSPAEVKTACAAAQAAVATVRSLLGRHEPADEGAPEFIGLVDVLPALAVLADAAQHLSSLGRGWTPSDGLPADLPLQLAEDILGMLVVTAVSRVHPAVRAILELVNVLTYPEPAEIATSGGTVVRSTTARGRFDFVALGRLVTRPGDQLRTLFGLDEGDGRTADQVGDDALPRVASLLRAVGIGATYGGTNQNVPPAVTGEDADALAHALRAAWQSVSTDATEAGYLALSVALRLADTAEGRAAVVAASGALAAGVTADTWSASASVSGTPPGLTIDRSGVTFSDATESLTASAHVDRPAGATPLARLGPATGPGLTIGGLGVSVTVTVAADGVAIEVALELSGFQVGAGAPASDGFAGTVIGLDGVTAQSQLTIAWSRAKGLTIGGSAALDLTVPLAVSVAGLRIQALRIQMLADDAGPQLAASVNLLASIGPVAATLTGFGVTARTVSGPPHLAVGIKPIDGAGLAIDAGAVTGAGFVQFDEANGRYLGAVQLTIPAIGLSISAVGLIVTKLPGGASGYSMVVLISIQFPPVQLGFGLALTGVGGLLGINRTVAVDQLQAGLQAGSLDSVLFPSGLTSDPAKVVTDLERFFPTAPDQYVFGPSVALTWGEAGLVTAHLGVYVEFPSPLRVVVLGQFRIALPTPDEATVDIRLDVLGSIDFTAKTVSIDAALRNSHVAAFTISGQAALRAAWGVQATFLLAVGGFHPAFAAPAGFPALQRVTIALSQSSNPRLRLQAYFALTSNTVQVGAHLDLYASLDIPVLGTFAIAATVGFDALFQFHPFAFEVDIMAGVALLRNGTPFLAILLTVTLTGPSPWHVAGTATFTCFGTHNIPFALTIGAAAAEAPPARVALLPLIVRALAQPENRRLQPPTEHSLVTLSVAATAALGQLLHPFAKVSVRQKIAPLGLELAKYGTAPLSDGPRYTISSATLGGTAGTPVSDEFAVGQYLVLRPGQLLSAPSFQPFPAGVSFDGAALVTDTASAQTADTAVITYDMSVVSPAAAAHAAAAAVSSTAVIGDEIVLRQLATAASARNGAGNRGATAFAGPPAGVAAVRPTYAVASAATLAPLRDDAGTPLTYLPNAAGAGQNGPAIATRSARVVETSDSQAPPIPAVVPGLTSAAYYTLTAEHSGCRLAAAQTRVGSPYQVQQALPDTYGDQFWRLLPVGDGSYVILAEGPGTALGADETGNGTPVTLRAPLVSPTTGWRVTPVGAATYRIELTGAGRCLDVIGGPTAAAPGTGLQLWDWWGGTNQTWRLQAVSAGNMLRQRIREAAFARWLARGAPLWSALADWGAARQQVMAEAVRAEAWWRYVRRGEGGGHAVDDWLAAERTITSALESP